MPKAYGYQSFDEQIGDVFHSCISLRPTHIYETVNGLTPCYLAFPENEYSKEFKYIGGGTNYPDAGSLAGGGIIFYVITPIFLRKTIINFVLHDFVTWISGNPPTSLIKFLSNGSNIEIGSFNIKYYQGNSTYYYKQNGVINLQTSTHKIFNPGDRLGIKITGTPGSFLLKPNIRQDFSSSSLLPSEGYFSRIFLFVE